MDQYPYSVLFCKNKCPGHKKNKFFTVLQKCKDANFNEQYLAFFCCNGCKGHYSENEFCINLTRYIDYYIYFL